MCTDLAEEDKKEFWKFPIFRHTYCKHEQICYLGELSDVVYLLKQGHIKISQVNEKGQEAILSLIEPGEFFGEVEALSGIPRQTLVRALEPVLVCEISRENLERVVERCPTMGICILKTIGGRLQRIETMINHIVFHSALARLRKLLLQLGKTMGGPELDHIRFKAR